MKKLLIALQVLAASGLVAATAPAEKSKMNTNTQATCTDFQRGDDPVQSMPTSCKIPGSYNYPAAININSGWDLYGDVSYIYWYANQDGMDLATTGNYITGDFEVVKGVNQGASAVFQNSNYTSGFKVGTGANLNWDNWVVDLEYTYLRESTNASYSNPTSALDIPVYNFTGWVVPTYNGSNGTGATKFNSKWKFNLDWIDFMFKRPNYQGCALSVTPSAGLRVSLIRQTLKITSSEGIAYEFLPYNLSSTTSSNSWAIGPRGLVDLHWVIAGGFRFQGNFGASLLFTQYTQLKHYDNGIVYEDTAGASFALRNYNCLRPMAEGNLGIGWGTYSHNNKYHWDLSATYDFNYLWNQNMLRYVVSLNSAASGPDEHGPAYGAGAAFYDAYLHGLTLKGRFDF